MDNKAEIKLNAVIVAIIDNNPVVLSLVDDSSSTPDKLPAGSYIPANHNSLDDSFLKLAVRQTGMILDHCTQLHSVANNNSADNSISINYLAMVSLNDPSGEFLTEYDAQWKSIYCFLPWEDWRNGRPAIIDEIILPAIHDWGYEGGEAHSLKSDRLFGNDNFVWNPELARNRLELMTNSGLLEESIFEEYCTTRRVSTPLGNTMRAGNRLALASAIDHMRFLLRYIPVIPDLMSREFTLTQLQNCSECICGQTLHKQNFRRQIENLKLVVPTGKSRKVTGGRPAALYKFDEI